MLFVELDELTQLCGLTGVIGLGIVILFGILVLYEAIIKKERILFMFFLAIIFTVSPWLPCDIGYIYWLITKNEIEYQIYVLLGTFGIPIAIIAWLDIYMTIMKPDKKKVVLISYAIFSLTFYIYLFYFLLLVPDAPIKAMIGYRRTPLDINYKGYILVYMGVSIIVGTYTGLEFAIVSMKMKDNLVVQWKGRFLLVSFILFAVGAVGDALLELNTIMLIIIKIILMISSLFYYIGFIMPKWMRKLLKIE
ncbi:MAG: hypothetical protein EU535_00095 [Promethearchaeota archaeon]|nr:MAG: hypothetical protein EU535_00095 [Candidatus Lokiarchaeota archaeon]